MQNARSKTGTPRRASPEAHEINHQGPSRECGPPDWAWAHLRGSLQGVDQRLALVRRPLTLTGLATRSSAVARRSAAGQSSVPASGGSSKPEAAPRAARGRRRRACARALRAPPGRRFGVEQALHQPPVLPHARGSRSVAPKRRGTIVARSTVSVPRRTPCPRTSQPIWSSSSPRGRRPAGRPRPTRGVPARRRRCRARTAGRRRARRASTRRVAFPRRTGRGAAAAAGHRGAGARRRRCRVSRSSSPDSDADRTVSRGCPVPGDRPLHALLASVSATFPASPD